VLFSYLHTDLPSGLFPSSFPTKILYAFQTSFISDTCPAQDSLLDLITVIFGEVLKLWSSSLCNFLQTHVTSTVIRPPFLKQPQSLFFY